MISGLRRVLRQRKLECSREAREPWRRGIDAGGGGSARSASGGAAAVLPLLLHETGLPCSQRRQIDLPLVHHLQMKRPPQFRFPLMQERQLRHASIRRFCDQPNSTGGLTHKWRCRHKCWPSVNRVTTPRTAEVNPRW
jgi:hypothetical protein